jgi:hypothetical protein
MNLAHQQHGGQRRAEQRTGPVDPIDGIRSGGRLGCAAGTELDVIVKNLALAPIDREEGDRLAAVILRRLSDLARESVRRLTPALRDGRDRRWACAVRRCQALSLPRDAPRPQARALQRRGIGWPAARSLSQ